MTQDDNLPIIAGHQLSVVVDGRFGPLVRIGRTVHAFRTIPEAIEYAEHHPVTLNELISEYQAFNLREGLQLVSADEHLFDERLSPSQRLWLVDFIRRWDSVCEHERSNA